MGNPKMSKLRISKLRMRKWIAWMLVLMLALTCSVASADTVEVRFSLNQEAVKETLAELGVPAGLQKVIDPMLGGFSVLGVRAITAEDGAQVDLELNEGKTISLAWKTEGRTLTAVTTLFPNFAVKADTEMLNLLFSMLPGTFGGILAAGAGAGAAEGEGTMSIMPVTMQTYLTNFIKVCTVAATPGEPVRGEYSFDGTTFDTMVPVKVDIPLIRDTFKTMTAEMFRDESIVSSLQPMEKMSRGLFGVEQLKIVLDQFANHFPDAVTAEVYSNSDGSPAMYVVGRAEYAGKEGPSFEYSMLRKDAETLTVNFSNHDQGIRASVATSDLGLRMEVDVGGKPFILDIVKERGGMAMYRGDFYFMNTENPLFTVSYMQTEEGARTVSVDTEGKKVLDLAEIFSGQVSETVMNGLSSLILRIARYSPELAGLLAGWLVPQQDSKQVPEKTEQEEPKEVADPSAWKTLGDVFALETGGMERGTVGADRYYAVFEYGGTTWFVSAPLSEEQFRQILDVDIFEEDWEAKQLAVLAPCVIDQVIDLRTLALPQEELDRWIGKTGQDLLDAGWEYNSYHSDESGIHVCMVNGDFEYLVSFAEELKQGQVYGDQPENMPSATITGMVFSGKSFHFDEMNYVVPAANQI